MIRASALLVALIACESAPAAPTYRADIKEIVDANCVRCHGAIPRNGAPDSFRLDVFSDFTFDDGRAALGAGLLSGFMAARAHAGTMPPMAPLSDRHVEILERWGVLGDAEAERGDPDPGNAPPEITTTDIAVGDDGLVTVGYEILDPDFEIVTGRLTALSEAGDSIEVTRELYSGRGQALWDTGVLEPGRYQLVAAIDDGNQRVEVTLDEVDVPGGNRAPAPEFCQLSRDTVIADSDLPLSLAVGVSDDDPQVSLELFADRAGESISLGSLDTPPRGCDDPLALTIDDTSMLEAGGNWRLRLVATDGERAREATSMPIIIGHTTNAPSFANDVVPVLRARCSPCHGAGIAPVGAIFTEVANAQGREGFIYRYVVQTETMPPRSAALVVPEGFEPMTAAERQIVADWILAGSPDN